MGHHMSRGPLNDGERQNVPEPQFPPVDVEPQESVAEQQVLTNPVSIPEGSLLEVCIADIEDALSRNAINIRFFEELTTQCSTDIVLCFLGEVRENFELKVMAKLEELAAQNVARDVSTPRESEIERYEWALLASLFVSKDSVQYLVRALTLTGPRLRNGEVFQLPIFDISKDVGAWLKYMTEEQLNTFFDLAMDSLPIYSEAGCSKSERGYSPRNDFWEVFVFSDIPDTAVDRAINYQVREAASGSLGAVALTNWCFNGNTEREVGALRAVREAFLESPHAADPGAAISFDPQKQSESHYALGLCALQAASDEILRARELLSSGRPTDRAVAVSFLFQMALDDVCGTRGGDPSDFGLTVVHQPCILFDWPAGGAIPDSNWNASVSSQRLWSRIVAEVKDVAEHDSDAHVKEGAQLFLQFFARVERAQQLQKPVSMMKKVVAWGGNLLMDFVEYWRPPGLGTDIRAK